MLFNQKKNIVIMVSLSKDGEILSRILDNFGYLTVRGSSSKKAQSALIEIIRYARKGYSLAFAADGPRGPYHKLKSGVVYVAKKTGLPLIPISCFPKSKVTFNKSWDKTIIPLPFSKIIQVYGKPIHISVNDNIDEKVNIVEKSLDRLFMFTKKYYHCKDIIQYLSYHPAPKILIIQPSRIGDIVFSLPVISALKRRYVNARISWIVDDRCCEILEENPCLENVIVWDRRQISFKYYKKLRQKLKNQRFDLSIDLHGLAKSAVFVNFAQAKFKIASSSTNGMKEFSWLFSKEIKSPKTYHCVERHFEVAKYLGCDDKINYPISISEINFKNVREKLLKENINIKNIVGIHPGAGWISRRWCSYNFAMLARRLKTEINADVVIIGGKEGGADEKGLSEKIIIDSGVKIVNMTGKFTLKELCAFLKMCRVFVGNEAGPMHIATVLGTQVVAILGPTNANLTGPYYTINTKIIQHKLICHPCRNRKCKNIMCMRNITVHEIFEEVKKKYENFNY
jgi:lipopolysaccharide heptosyltransferase II